MKRILLILIVLLSTTLIFAQTDYNTQGGGTVPLVHSLDLTWDAGNATVLNGVTAEDYNTGYVEIAGFLTLGLFSANGNSTVGASISSWSTLPGGYTGNKTTTADNSDFYFKVNDLGLTDLTVQNSFGSPVELTSSTVTMLENSTGTGCSNEPFSLDARIELDWETDIPGDYVADIVITVAQLPE